LNRRTFLAMIAGGMVAAPLAAEGQQGGKVWRIGLLSYAASDSGGAARWKAFREQLRELGYVEGQNVFFESRWGDVQVGRLRGLAAELMRRSTSW
jgi:putative ABC transport system substrate-binding protein